MGFFGQFKAQGGMKDRTHILTTAQEVVDGILVQLGNNNLL